MKHLIKILVILLFLSNYSFGNSLYTKAFLYYKKGNLIYSISHEKGKKYLEESFKYFQQLNKIKINNDPVVDFYLGNILEKIYYNNKSNIAKKKLVDALGYLKYAYQNGTSKAICPLIAIKIELNYPNIEIQQLVSKIKKNSDILKYCNDNYSSFKNYLK